MSWGPREDPNIVPAVFVDAAHRAGVEGHRGMAVAVREPLVAVREPEDVFDPVVVEKAQHKRPDDVVQTRA